MTDRYVDTVSKLLRQYADRGVIRQLHQSRPRRNKHLFTFRWLAENEFAIELDPSRELVQMKNLFPDVPPRSYLDMQIREFLKAKQEKSLPAHRRVDRGRAELQCTNRKGDVSLVVRVKRNQYTYAVKRLLNLVNELWNSMDQQYMWDHFDIPQE